MSDISSGVMTKGDKIELEMLIDDYLADLFKKKSKIKIPQKYENFFQKYGYTESGIDPSINKEEVKEQLISYKSTLSQLEDLKVTLSFEPTKEFINRLYSWVKSNLSAAKFVLDINVDPGIVGGLVMVWKGKYVDLSVKERLKKYFKENRKDVQDLLWS